MRLFLDACALNRPFDDRGQPRIYVETVAVLTIISEIRDGKHQLITSDSLELEVVRNPDIGRREAVTELLHLASHRVTIGEREAERVRELLALAFRVFDALHLACAESGGVERFLTSDDGLLRAARRAAQRLHVRVANPLAWVAEGEP